MHDTKMHRAGVRAQYLVPRSDRRRSRRHERHAGSGSRAATRTTWWPRTCNDSTTLRMLTGERPTITRTSSCFAAVQKDSRRYCALRQWTSSGWLMVLRFACSSEGRSTLRFRPMSHTRVAGSTVEPATSGVTAISSPDEHVCGQQLTAGATLRCHAQCRSQQLGVAIAVGHIGMTGPGKGLPAKWKRLLARSRPRTSSRSPSSTSLGQEYSLQPLFDRLPARPSKNASNPKPYSVAIEVLRKFDLRKMGKQSAACRSQIQRVEQRFLRSREMDA